MRLDGILRVSQRKGKSDDQFRSPDQQKGVCEDWARRHGGEIIKWHPAIDVSGKTMDRDDIREVRARILSGATDGVIVGFVNRFSRAPIEEAMAVYREIIDAGGRFVACDMADLQPDDPYGETMLVFSFQMSRQQWLEAKRRFDMSRRDAIARGKKVGKCPFGYRYIDPTPRQVDADGTPRGVLDSRLVPDPVEAPIVLELFKRRAAGANLYELTRWLDQAAPKPTRWRRSTVEKMLRCKTYLGEVHHGKFSRPEAHLPIVPEPLWHRVQRVHNGQGPGPHDGAHLLSHLVRCAECGRRMTVHSGGTRRPVSFVCKNPECGSGLSISERALEAEVIDQLRRRGMAVYGQMVDDKDLAAAATHAKDLGEQLVLLAKVRPTHPVALAAHQEELSALERELTDADRRVEELRAVLAEGGHAWFPGDWDARTDDGKRRILQRSIDTILVRQSLRAGRGSRAADRIRVMFRGEAPPELAERRTVVLRRWIWDENPGSLRFVLKDL